MFKLNGLINGSAWNGGQPDKSRIWNAKVLIVPRVSQLPISSFMRDTLEREIGLRRPIILPSMSANESIQYDLNSAELKPFRKFPYINALYVDNNDTDAALNIDLDTGDQRRILVPKTYMKSYGGLSFTSFTLTTSADFTSGSVIVTPAYEVDDAVRIAGMGGK